mmetsp:Transcript_11761/g.29784  ORF Transcript_11761/g.29784 Transcript_11761/m.29784 type:complete len:286 (-) Transcript_11761:768-1625(-)
MWFCNGRSSCKFASLPPGLAHATRPSLSTSTTERMLAISSDGSFCKTTKSAKFPASTLPRFSPRPSASWPLDVAAFKTSSGLRPARCSASISANIDIPCVCSGAPAPLPCTPLKRFFLPRGAAPQNARGTAHAVPLACADSAAKPRAEQQAQNSFSQPALVVTRPLFQFPQPQCPQPQCPQLMRIGHCPCLLLSLSAAACRTDVRLRRLAKATRSSKMNFPPPPAGSHLPPPCLLRCLPPQAAVAQARMYVVARPIPRRCIRPVPPLLATRPHAGPLASSHQDER